MKTAGIAILLALTCAPITRADSTGTGFFITPDGYLVTNFHVVDGGVDFAVRLDEKFVPARIVRTDAANDLAILKVDVADHPHLPLSFRAAVRPGDPAFTVGFPDPSVLGLAAKTTRGEISALSGIKDDARFYQTTVEIQPGNSGGPLCDERGNVIAVTTLTINAVKRLEEAGYLPQNINYGLKAAYLRPLIETVAKLDGKLAAPIPDEAEPEKFRAVQARVQSSVALVFAKHPEVAEAEPEANHPEAPPAPAPETPTRAEATPNIYTGNVGRLDATYLLAWEADDTVSGYYYYPSRGQENKYALSGNNHEEGKLYLEEFSDGDLSARCYLTKELTSGQIIWRGTMKNLDGREHPMTIRRNR